MTRREDERLLRGSAAFVDDVDRDGQLWLAVVRSPVAHGHLRAVDGRAALRHPGVQAVLTADDLDEVPHIPIRVLPGPGTEARRQPVIARDRVRYVGEPVGVVVAADPYVAEDAAELVDVDVDPLPPALEAVDGEPCLWDPPLADNVACELHGYHGDVATAFADAAAVVELDLGVQRHSGMPIETRGLVAEWTDDTLHLWGVTKYVQFTRATVSAFLGVPEERVICHRVDVGGMFGVRGEVYPEDFLVPWAARVTGRPVKWVEDRREHFLAINHAREHRQKVRMAIAGDGSFLGLTSDGVIDMGAYARPIGGRLVQIAVESMPGPYRWPALDVRVRGIVTNKTPVGTMRGPTSYETTFVRERLIDVAAARVGLDPIDVRRRNLVPSEDMPFVLDMGPEMEEPVYDAGDYPGQFDELLERIAHDELAVQVADRRARGEAVGIGVAAFMDHSGLGLEESVELALHPDGRFVLGTTAAEIGQGLASMAASVIADTAGIAPDGIEVLSGDSRAHGGGQGTFASRTTIFVGNAAADAAQRLREEAVERAAKMLGAAPLDLSVTPEGFVHGKEVLNWKDVAPLKVVGQHRMEKPTQGFGTVIAVVSVDTVTGGAQVERLVVGYDCGRAIDRESARAQLAGAAVMGIGGALFEELRFDEDGQPQVTTFMDYLIPTCAECPAVEAHVIENGPVPGNPLGVRGVGEAGILGVGAAIANAAAAATGTGDMPALTHLPLKPEVLRPLAVSAQAAKGGGSPRQSHEGGADE